MRGCGGRAPDDPLTRRRLAAALALFGMALVGAMTAVVLVVSDRTWWGECLAVWPPLLWALGPLLLAVLVWGLGLRSWAAVLGAATLVALAATTEWPILLRRPSPARIAQWDAARSRGEGAPPAPGTPLALRVVSWNVSREGVLPLLEPLRPDLALLQEAAPLGGTLSGAWAGFTWTLGDDPGTLSRWPAQRLYSTRVGPWRPPLLLLVEAPGNRRLLVANVRLALPEVVLAVVSPFEVHDIVRGHRPRVAQFETLAALLARTEDALGVRSVVLCGDFNTPAGLASLAPLRERYVDAWAAGGVGWGGTMGEDLPLARIDQCWVSRDLDVVRARVERGRPSDHRRLVVDLLVP